MTDATELLERIAYAALTTPWDGPTGPRTFRVLCTILRRQRGSSLVGHVGLRELSVTAGLSDSGKLTRPALTRLAEDGWLRWNHDRFENHTQIELVERRSDGTWPVHLLPDPTSDAFNHDAGGSGGYLMWSFVKFSGRHILSLDDLVALTGLPTKDVEAAMTRMVVGAHLVDISGGKYSFEDTPERIDGWYGFSKFKERSEKLWRGGATRQVRGAWS